MGNHFRTAHPIQKWHGSLTISTWMKSTVILDVQEAQREWARYVEFGHPSSVKLQ